MGLKKHHFKILISTFLVLLFFLEDLHSQIYNIADENGNTINTCSGIFTDSDAFSDNFYINNEAYLVTFCSDQPGECIALDFTSMNIPDSQDWLYIWDGSDTISGTYVGKYNNPFGNNTNNLSTLYPNGIQSTSGCFTFFFDSDGDINTGSGWEAIISCYSSCATCFDGIENGMETGIDCGGICSPCPEPINIADGGTVNTCQSVFTDSGGITGDYQNNESSTITICSDNPNPSYCLQAAFTQFSTENFWDYLYIYDGPSINSPVIGIFTGTNSPGSIVASGTCLTFYFDSDFIINNYDGWIANISCGDCAPEPVPSIADCLGALPICSAIQNEATPNDGDGNVSNELPGNACGMPEIEVLWYIFDIGSDGIFNFSLDADPQTNGDYDWALYDITGISCDNISSATSVSCNTYGLFTGSGNVPTGISTALGGTGNANGPGDINGPAFNQDVNVVSGETYALVISNCCGATAGFEIDFGASTADIYDNVEPVIVEVVPSCANNEVSVAFSELVDCTSIGELDFQVVGANGNYNVTGFSSDWCNAGLDGTLTIDLFLDGVMLENEDYVLSLTNADGGVSDICGNANIGESFAFLTSASLTIETVLTPSDCAGTIPNGSAEIIVIGGFAPYYVELGTQYDYDVDVFLFENLLEGTQTVNVYDNAGCEATFFIEIPSSNSFMENDIIVSNVSCLGGDGSIEIFTSGGPGYGPWQYQLTDTSGTTILNASNTDYFNANNLEVGSYFINITDLSGLSPCSDLQEIIVGDPDPIIISSINDTTICYNGQASVAAWVSGGTGSPFTIYWSDGINTSTTNPGQFQSTGVLTDDLTYIVYAQDDLGCYSDSIAYNVTVSDLISFDMSPSQIVCVNTELLLTVDNIIGGINSVYDVSWDLGNGIIIPGNEAIVQPDIPTSYCVYVSDQCETPDVDSCIVISPTLNVPVSFTIDSDTAACPPYLVNFTNTTDPLELSSVHWYFGDGVEAQSLNTASHIYTQSGNYNVGLSIVTPDGCEFDTLAINAITIHPIPFPFFVMDPQITTLTNTDIQFENQSNGAINYYWIFDTINNIGESYEENPLFVFPDQLPDEYYIKLFAYNVFGCENSVTQLLIVNEDLTLYIPNSFSPNGDGKNDYFYAKGIAIDPSEFSLKIYDRWGTLVFEGNDINEKWNGSVNNSEYYAEAGVYAYILSYKTMNTLEKKVITGSVTLLK